MKAALSNIALPAFDHGRELAALRGMGIEGLEVAPSRAWRHAWRELRPAQVEAYRRQVEDAGLGVIGLHSLFYDQPDLGLFKDRETRRETLDFMEHLSRLCRDLGGRTLIYGGGRKRGDWALEDATREATDFFFELCPRIEDHGTIFCFEPLGPEDSDFINSVLDSVRIVEAVNSPSLKVQLDAKALVENDEVGQAAFEAARPNLVHFHANEPGLGVLGSSGRVDHGAMGRLLRSIGYDGYVSIEQRQLSPDAPLADVATSAAVLKEYY